MADKEKDNKSLMDSIKLIVGKEDKLNDQLKKDQGLEGYAKDLLLLMSLVKDYYQGNYRNIPYKTISAAVVGLLYVLNPIDIIPDFIPFIGHIDDALVLKFCLKMIDKDLTKYKKWKDEQTATEDRSADKDKDSKSTFKKPDTKKSDKEQSSKDK
ncbi:YkvA family protein [Psychrobacter sp. A3]|uniref:YkvA family protein n=1 Tax=Psychrobacter sp. A3 TaxID=2992754 RepID=UPI00237B0A16|nr:YkvA family protein [Psychrobacter sp. A3]MDE0491347.1 YkvA family protein [Psychrobacter sp. A3]